LSLCGGRVNGQSVAAFGDARPDLRLEALDLGGNVLRQRGAESLASAPCLSELKSLRLDRCEIPLAGARLLAKEAAFLGDLRLLDVGYNHFSSVGLADLLEREPPSLHTLRMRDNDLFDKGAELLARSPASNALLEVDLSHNGLGDAAAQALGGSAHLGRLLILRLSDNSINESAAATLAASPLGRRLAVLDLETTTTRHRPSRLWLTRPISLSDPRWDTRPHW
jgi:Ran GTPase-activating protein (RanGAP) involved in mRNA processing and transport